MSFQLLRAGFVGLGMLAALAPGSASAQTPAGPSIKFIITHPAGGLPDTVARIVGRRLQERIGQTVVVENRAGANGGIAVSPTAVRKSVYPPFPRLSFTPAGKPGISRRGRPDRGPLPRQLPGP